MSQFEIKIIVYKCRKFRLSITQSYHPTTRCAHWACLRMLHYFFILLENVGPDTLGPFFIAYQNLPGRCLVCKHDSHVINIPKADCSSVKNKQLTATPCWVLVGYEKRAYYYYYYFFVEMPFYYYYYYYYYYC